MSDVIVLGIDDSEGARTALAWAARQATATGARLRVVHAYDLNLAWIEADNPDIPLWERRAQIAARQLLERVVNDVVPSFDASRLDLHVCGGRPEAVLLQEARAANLLVVGSRGRGGFAGLLLGSVSQRLAQSSPCPVVIVPPPSRVPTGPARL
jgi:nucleotide-binding universal stress UspA family protein